MGLKGFNYIYPETDSFGRTFFFNLRGAKTERDSVREFTASLLPNAHKGRGSAGPKREAGNAVEFCVGGGYPLVEPSLLPLRVCTGRKPESEARARDQSCGAVG